MRLTSVWTSLIILPHLYSPLASLRKLQPKTVDPSFLLPLTQKRIVILLASFRGGSSFLGQLFDSNPTVQYLFEPFHDEALNKKYRTGWILGAKTIHSKYTVSITVSVLCSIKVSSVVSETARVV